jgi:BR serine/threonine kinase
MGSVQRIEIGPYILDKTLGSGTTNKVNLAMNQETKELVAIKIIPKALFESRPNLQPKIQREVVLMRLLTRTFFA